MQIIIQRHGFPDTGEWEKINAKDMPSWITIYNNAGVVPTKPPCTTSIAHANKSVVISSTLERSKHSAKLLTSKNIDTYDVFCEAELPVINIPLLKMKPHTWSMIFRVLWFIGIAKETESKKEIRMRVQTACQILEKLAEKHGNILLVGHGIMNRLIAQALLKKGWDGEDAPNGKKYYGFRYWEYSIFTRSVNN